MRVKQGCHGRMEQLITRNTSLVFNQQDKPRVKRIMIKNPRVLTGVRDIQSLEVSLLQWFIIKNSDAL
jgi:hypothetical protein